MSFFRPKKRTEPTAQPRSWGRFHVLVLRLRTLRSGEIRRRLRLSRSGPIFAVTGGTLVLYALLVFALFAFVRYRQQIAAVGYLDLLLPSRWSRYGVARGDHHIAAAQNLAHDGKLTEALLLVRLGVAQSPANRDGRLLLAQLLLQAQRAETARQVLLDGLVFHRTDPLYLRPLLAFLLQQQEDSRVIALARALRPAHRAQPASAECDRLLALAAATASYFRGNYDQADDFLRSTPYLASSRDARMLTAKIHWACGYQDLALLQLRGLAAEFPDDSEIHTEVVARLRESQRLDEARRLSLAYQIAHPALPGPRLELLAAYHLAGEHARVAREADAYVRDFAPDPAALLALAEFAANSGDPALAGRLCAHAKARHLPWEPHAILVVEAHVVAHDFRAALDATRDLLRENPRWDSRYASLLTSLQAIAHYGLGDRDAGRLFLSSYLSQPELRADHLLALANRLADIDASEEARQTLIRAIAADPHNQAALSRLVEFDLNLNRIDELPAHLRALLAMRQPSPDLLRVAQHKLGSDLFLFSAERPAALEAVRLALEKTSPATPRL